MPFTSPGVPFGTLPVNLPSPTCALGRQVQKDRKAGLLATKFSPGHGEPDRLVKANPEYVQEACDKPLSRSGVDYVDFHYLHRADLTVPIEHTAARMAELVK